MDHLDKASVLVNVVRHGGFAAAARALGITGSAVSKQVQQLEETLGVKLLTRTTRRVGLTEQGRLYHDRMVQVLEAAAEAEAMVRSYAAEPKGVLRISIPAGFGQMYLKEALVDFSRRYPAITVALNLSDRHVDIQGEGFDLAIRIGALADSALVAKKLCGVTMSWTASLAYLKEHGVPKKPADLLQHRILGYGGEPRPMEWLYQDKRGARQRLALHPAFFSDSGDMLLEAALKHQGLTILPGFYTQKHLQVGTLQAVLTEYATLPERAIYAVMPPSRYMPYKVRVFIEFITAFMKKRPF